MEKATHPQLCLQSSHPFFSWLQRTGQHVAVALQKSLSGSLLCLPLWKWVEGDILLVMVQQEGCEEAPGQFNISGQTDITTVHGLLGRNGPRGDLKLICHTFQHSSAQLSISIQPLPSYLHQQSRNCKEPTNPGTDPGLHKFCNPEIAHSGDMISLDCHTELNSDRSSEGRKELGRRRRICLSAPAHSTSQQSTDCRNDPALN